MCSRACFGVLTIACLGCTSIAGLDDLVFASNGATVAASGTGGHAQGGSAGAGAAGEAGSPSLPAANWSGAMLAFYDFEDPADLGSDRSGHANHLTALLAPTPYDRDPPQGAQAVAVDSPNGIGFTSSSTDFHSPSGTSLTVGGWFHTEFIYTQPVGRASDTPDLGYSIGRGDTSSAFCFVGDGAWSNVVGLGVWPDFTWTHVVCRYDYATKYTTGFANGGVFGSVLKGDVLNAEREFEVPSFDNGYRYLGEMDEVFFIKQALSDAAIARIWACGIDGTRCRCQQEAPAAYADCGRASPDCASLPACDAAMP